MNWNSGAAGLLVLALATFGFSGPAYAECPARKRVESLQKMAEAGEVQVHFLLFPLETHKGAREQSVSTICDKKSLHDFENGYQSQTGRFPVLRQRPAHPLGAGTRIAPIDR